MTKKRVLIIYTGGTIGMLPSGAGYKVKKNYLGQCLSKMPELADATMPEWDLIEYESLIDSSDANIKFWQKIADDIEKHYQDYDGFIVLHGTDTMAYTASMVSFLLEGLAKPVIFTGSQVPLSVIRSDGHNNVVNALYIAAHYKIPEVCICFNDSLLRANRATKISAARFTAFKTFNYPKLARIGINIDVDAKALLPMTDKKLCVAQLQDTHVACFRFFPGMAHQILEAMLEKPTQAIVLETFGAGHIPTDPALLSLLKEAADSGVILVNCTQCSHGKVDMAAYHIGKELLAMGMLSAGDMTVEATVTKLQYLLSQKKVVQDKLKELIGSNMRGEVSQK